MLFWGFNHFLKLLGYCFCYKIFFGVEFKNWKRVIIVAIVTSVIAQIMVQLKTISFLPWNIYLCLLFSVIIIYYHGWHIVCALFPIIFILYGCINILSSYIISSIMNIDYYIFIKANSWATINNMATLIVLIVWSFFLRKKEKIEITIKLKDYLALLVGGIALFVVVAFSQGVLEEDIDLLVSFKMPIAISSIVVGLYFMVGILLRSYQNNQINQYKTQELLYRQYLMNQEMHIRDIFEADNKLRRFRHDINAHITAIDGCLKNKDYMMLHEYVGRLKHEARNTLIELYSGISAVDAIVSEYHILAREKKIEWRWSGTLPDTVETEVFDICVVLSNLLSNAVEASEKVAEDKTRFVNIQIGYLDGDIMICVSNSCTTEERNNKSLKTTKRDASEHGFGIENIRKIVEKRDGQFRTYYRDSTFIADVLL